MLCLILWKLHAVSDDSAVNKLLMGHCSLFAGVMKADFGNLLVGRHRQKFLTSAITISTTCLLFIYLFIYFASFNDTICT